MLRPSNYIADDDDDDEGEGGTSSFFDHRPTIHRHQQHMSYGSTAEAPTDQMEGAARPSSDTAGVEPFSDVHVAGRRRQRSRRGHRPHTLQTSQPDVEDV